MERNRSRERNRFRVSCWFAVGGSGKLTPGGDEEDGEGDGEDGDESVSSLFIGNLPSIVSSKWMYATFGKYGKVVQVFFPRRRGRFFRYAFVRLFGFPSARVAIKELNGHPMGGRPLVVRWATRRSVVRTVPTSGIRHRVMIDEGVPVLNVRSSKVSSRGAQGISDDLGSRCVMDCCGSLPVQDKYVFRRNQCAGESGNLPGSLMNCKASSLDPGSSSQDKFKYSSFPESVPIPGGVHSTCGDPGCCNDGCHVQASMGGAQFLASDCGCLRSFDQAGKSKLGSSGSELLLPLGQRQKDLSCLVGLCCMDHRGGCLLGLQYDDSQAFVVCSRFLEDVGYGSASSYVCESELRGYPSGSLHDDPQASAICSRALVDVGGGPVGSDGWLFDDYKEDPQVCSNLLRCVPEEEAGVNDVCPVDGKAISDCVPVTPVSRSLSDGSKGNDSPLELCIIAASELYEILVTGEESLASI